ncbi:MAG TPA: cob(I)yrinic acid a,c-diamide adenosyltransferase, partial [Micropepsaceae bacterium]
MKLDRIYTRGGDAGRTSLGDGARVPKHHLRVHAVGGLDEANAAIGVARLHIEDAEVGNVLALAQNDLFDVGADMCRPEQPEANRQPLRVSAQQVLTVERQIDRFNEALSPLTSFVLPGGSPASAYLHLARTMVRRAERDMAELAAGEAVNAEALKYVNRLSDLLFVLGRYTNQR